MTRRAQYGLSVAFFLSGASALLFETLWFRLAGVTLGNGVWASSLVLSSFMAGLALGSVVVAKLRHRFARPLRVYATLEIVIGVTGLGIVLLLPRLTFMLTGLYQAVLDNAFALNSIRLGVSFLVLLIPATAMGATLPLVVGTLTRSDADFGRVLGRLYGWNTFGAVAGALAGELLFIGALGLRGSGLVAAGMNVLAAAAVTLWVLPRAPENTSVEPTRLASALRSRGVVRLLVASFVAGGALLGFEVVWFRFMLLFRNSTSLIFALMLSVVLAGIALGGFLASRWLRDQPTAYRYLPYLALGAGVLVCVTYGFLNERMELLAALPISTMSGILFTFIGRALKDEIADETDAAAALTFANTVGAMLGSAAAGFVLLPRLGVEGAFFVLSTAYAVVALCTLGAGAPRTAGESRMLKGAGALAALAFALFPFGLMNRHFLPQVLASYTVDGSVLVGAREGLTETAFYLRKDFYGDARYHRLVTNGFSMSATNFRSRRYMKLFTYWPVAVRPESKRALLISYGVGLTAQALTETDSLESIDVVDISSNVVELSRDVQALAGKHPLDDPRVRVHIEDGRFFLLASRNRYDIITAEPPPPRNAGIANLYSREYFELLHDRLTPGGVATYWLPVYQLAVEESKAIVRAFCDAFEDCTLWTGAGTDWMLAGSNGLRGEVSADGFERQWQRPVVAARLRAIGVERPEQLGALFIADAPFLAEWSSATPPLVDNYPHRIQDRSVEEVADNSQNPEYLRVMDTEASARRFRDSEWVREVWPSGMRERTLPYFELQAIGNLPLSSQRSGVPEIHAALTDTDLTSLSLMLMGSDTEEWPTLENARRNGVDEPLLHYLLAAHAFSRREFGAATAHLDRAVALDSRSEELARLQILACVLDEDQERAWTLANELSARGQSSSPDFWSWFEASVGSEPRRTTLTP